MQVFQLILAFTALSGLGAGLVVKVEKIVKEVTASPTAQEYETGYPICNVAGFTETPGPYNQFIFQKSGATLQSCLTACQGNSTCKSIGWGPSYTECLFFDRPVNQTQLLADPTSPFIHYDTICTV